MNGLLPSPARPADMKPLNGELNRKPTAGFLSTLGVGDLTPDSSRVVSPLSTAPSAETPVVEQERTGFVRVDYTERIRARSQSPPQSAFGKSLAYSPAHSTPPDTYSRSVSALPCSASPANTSLSLQRSSQRASSISSCLGKRGRRGMPSVEEGSNRCSNSISDTSQSVDTHSQQTPQHPFDERGHTPNTARLYGPEEYASSGNTYQYSGVPPVLPAASTSAAYRVPQRQGVGPLSPSPSSVPPAFPSQTRSQLAYSIHPGTSFAHPTEFAPYGLPPGISHTQPSMYISAPSLALHFPPPSHAPVNPEQFASPAMPVEYDFHANASHPSMTGHAFSVRQQAYPLLNYQPAMSSAPQLVPALPVFPTHAPPRLAQPAPASAPPPSQYAGYIGQPTSDESTPAHQRPLQCWYISSLTGSQSAGGPYFGFYGYDGFLHQPILTSSPNDPTSSTTQGNLATRGRQALTSEIRSVPSSTASQYDQRLLSGVAGPLRLPELPGRQPLLTSDKFTRKHASPAVLDGLLRDPSDPAASYGTNLLSAQESKTNKEQKLELSSQEECTSSSSVSQITHRVARQGQQVQRSEWVMWVGNIPGDATEDELQFFFSKPGDSRSSDLPVSVSGLDRASRVVTEGAGITSIFLIARSKCAFVNYASQEHLQQALDRFNGQQLRPLDSRCPRLVCRIRGKEEDQRAGVGGQRASGMHVRWIKEQEQKRKVRKLGKVRESNLSDEESDCPGYSPASSIEPDDGASEPATPSICLPDHEHRNIRQSLDLRSLSSASTTSSILSRHFPKRYFIMKSLTQYDLNLSVSRGLWATQPHNESVLNQAYRTSREVYLVFGVNKSGEFFGYARMVGPIARSEERIAWATGSKSETSQLSAKSVTSVTTGNDSDVEGIMSGDTTQVIGRNRGRDDTGQQESSGLLFSPSERRLVEDCPRVLTPSKTYGFTATGHALGPVSASAPPSNRSRVHQSVLPARVSAPPALCGPTRIHLDSEAPLRAIREEQVRSPDVEQSSDVERDAPSNQSAASTSEAVPTASSTIARDRLDRDMDNVAQDDAAEGSAPTVWGTAFKVQWIRVGRLPFHRTKHLRNSWNHDREVKVSRDGTELEPNVGQALLDKWDNDASVSPSASVKRGNLGRKSNQSTS